MKSIMVSMLFLVLWSLPSFAQTVEQDLNENCTVSILNRTAQVRPDGTWLLLNVPSRFGEVRARATCVENGLTMSSEAGFFAVTTDRMSAIVPLAVSGAVEPIPESMLLSAPTTTLSATGATVQLTATAVFSDGSTTDVTALQGTNYSMSNPVVATVSPAGLVTALSSGTVLVSAVREGALGLCCRCKSCCRATRMAMVSPMILSWPMAWIRTIPSTAWKIPMAMG